MKMEKRTPFFFIKFSSRFHDRTKNHFVFRVLLSFSIIDLAYYFAAQLSL